MFSLCSFAWFMCTVWVSLGALFVTYPSLTPAIVLHLYAYGKIRKSKDINEKKETFLLPKSYFSHFYLSGIVCITTTFLMCLYVTCTGGSLPEPVLYAINTMRYPVTESYGDMFSNLLVLACANIQVVRRFLESMFVSVYSPNSKMSIVIYIIGVSFYAAVPVTSLSGTDLQHTFKCSDVLQSIQINHLLGLALFAWGSWQQNIVVHQFAKLRQDKSGKVENTKHHIPHGGLFEYVSCPHYFTEILIYLSMNIIFNFRNTMMIWMFIFVLVNQLITGHFSHKWYKETFPTYPKERKATIPYIL